MRKPRLAADAGRSAGEDHSAATEWHEPARSLAPDQESAEAADAPEILELLRRQFAEIDALIIAGIGDHEVRGLEAAARRHRAVEKPHDILLERRIRCDGLSAATRGNDRLGDLVDLGRRPPGDENVIAPLGEPTAQGCAKPAFGSNPHNDCARFSHLLLALNVGLRLVVARFGADDAAISTAS